MHHLLAAFAAHGEQRGHSPATIKRRAWTLRHWWAHTGGDLAGATITDVEAFIGTDRAPATRLALHNDLAAFYRWATARQLLPRSPILPGDAPRVPKRLPSPLAAEDVRRLIDHAQRPARTAIMLGAMAGLRVSEIARLRGDDVLLAGRVLVVRQGKGQRDTTVPLCRELATELHDLVAGHGPLFGCSGRTVSRWILTEMRRHGIEGRPHDLRHSFVTEAAMHSGGDLVKVQALSRLASLNTVQVYMGWRPSGADLVELLYRSTG